MNKADRVAADRSARQDAQRKAGVEAERAARESKISVVTDQIESVLPAALKAWEEHGFPGISEIAVSERNWRRAQKQVTRGGIELTTYSYWDSGYEGNYTVRVVLISTGLFCCNSPSVGWSPSRPPSGMTPAEFARWGLSGDAQREGAFKTAARVLREWAGAS